MNTRAANANACTSVDGTPTGSLKTWTQEREEESERQGAEKRKDLCATIKAFAIVFPLHQFLEKLLLQIHLTSIHANSHFELFGQLFERLEKKQRKQKLERETKEKEK